MIRFGNFLFRYRNGLFPAIFLLLFVNSPKIFHSDTVAVTLGITVAMAGQILRFITIGLAYIIRGGHKRQVYAEELVQTGVFAHCRNPLYVGNFLILVGLGLVANSVLFAAVGLPFFLLAYRAIVAAEENFLGKKFGDRFTAYCARVHRFIPNFSGFLATCRSMDFDWKRVLRKEYGSTFAWTAAAVLLLMKQEWTGSTVGHSERIALITALGLTIFFYVVARFLKKGGFLQSPGET